MLCYRFSLMILWSLVLCMAGNVRSEKINQGNLPEGKEKVDELLKSWSNNESWEDSILIIEALQLARTIEDAQGECSALILLGEFMYHDGDNGRAEQYFKKALNLAQRIHNKKLQIDAHDHLAELYDFSLDYVASYEHNIQAMKLSRDSDDTIGLLNSYLSQGIMFSNLSLDSLSDLSCKNALSLAHSIRDTFYIIQSLQCFYNNLNTKDYSDYAQYIDRVIQLSKSDTTYFEYWISYAMAMTIKAANENRAVDPRKALYYLNLAEEAAIRVNYGWVLADTYLQKSQSYQMLDMLDSAKHLLAKSGVLIQSEDDPYLRKRLFEQYVSYYDKVEDIQQKATYLDSLNNTIVAINENQKIINGVVTVFEDQILRKEARLKRKSTRSKWINFLTFCGFALLFYIGYRKFWFTKLLQVEEEKMALKENREESLNKLNQLQRALIIEKLKEEEKKKVIDLLISKAQNQQASMSNQEIIQLLTKIQKGDSTMLEFKTFFEQLEPEFLNILSRRHKKLTAHDLRICSFIRMGLSNKEIARITNVQPSSVTISKYRLKKKLKINRKNLDEYIRDL